MVSTELNLEGPEPALVEVLRSIAADGGESALERAWEALESGEPLEKDVRDRTINEAPTAVGQLAKWAKNRENWGEPCIVSMPEQRYKSFNRAFKRAVVAEGLGKLLRARPLERKGKQVKCVVELVEARRPRPSRHMPGSAGEATIQSASSPIQTIGLRELRNKIRRSEGSQWSDEDLDVAVMLRMREIDRAAPMQDGVLAAWPQAGTAELSEERALTQLARLRRWPACVRFIVENSRVLGYISCIPMMDEEIIGMRDFCGNGFAPTPATDWSVMGGGQTPGSGEGAIRPARDAVEARTIPVLYVASMRLGEAVRKGANADAYSRALLQGVVRVLMELAQESCRFERLYFCAHHAAEQALIERCRHFTHSKLEQSIGATPQIGTPLLRLHLQGWGINPGWLDELLLHGYTNPRRRSTRVRAARPVHAAAAVG